MMMKKILIILFYFTITNAYTFSSSSHTTCSFNENFSNCKLKFNKEKSNYDSYQIYNQKNSYFDFTYLYNYYDNLDLKLKQNQLTKIKYKIKRKETYYFHQNFENFLTQIETERVNRLRKRQNCITYNVSRLYSVNNHKALEYKSKKHQTFINSIQSIHMRCNKI